MHTRQTAHDLCMELIQCSFAELDELLELMNEHEISSKKLINFKNKNLAPDLIAMVKIISKNKK